MTDSPFRRLIRDEQGMTLIELLNVLVILGILLLIAVPGYLGLRDRSNQSAAKSNLGAVLPAVVLYATDNSPNSRYDPNADPTDSGYSNMSAAALQTHYDPTLDPATIAVVNTTATSYCIYTWVGPFTAAKNGPSSPVTVSLNSAFNPATCSGHL